jgi:hypothetical protein
MLRPGGESGDGMERDGHLAQGQTRRHQGSEDPYRQFARRHAAIERLWLAGAAAAMAVALFAYYVVLIR